MEISTHTRCQKLSNSFLTLFFPSSYQENKTLHLTRATSLSILPINVFDFHFILFLRWFSFKLFPILLILTILMIFRVAYVDTFFPPSFLLYQLHVNYPIKWKTNPDLLRREYLKGLLQGVGAKDYWDRTMGNIAIKIIPWP